MQFEWLVRDKIPDQVQKYDFLLLEQFYLHQFPACLLDDTVSSLKHIAQGEESQDSY